MGLSASQARYLSLTAQKSNLEYQAQQINQERSILSQQVSELYNSLLNIQVPTPPSTQDFTTVTYKGDFGADTFSIPAMNIKPGKDGKYSVTVEQKGYDDALTINRGYSTVKAGEEELVGNTYTSNDNLEAVKAEDLYVYDTNTGTVRKAQSGDYTKIDGKIQLKDGMTYFIEQEGGSQTAKVKGAAGYTVKGSNCYTLEDAKNNGVINKELYEGFVDAIKNSFPQTGENVYKPEDFYIFRAADGNWNFALIKDVTNGDSSTATYSYEPNGVYTEKTTYNPCDLTFDAATGRIISISIPTYKEGTDEIISTTTVNLEAVTVTDELAYKDAYAQYEYKQYEYDKQQQEINAKTEVIQQQDRNLELRLTRLESQRKQITTELDALKTVIEDNIDKTFKTFG